MAREFGSAATAAHACLAGRRIVFAGDSRARQLWLGMIALLDKSAVPQVTQQDYHTDMSVTVATPSPMLVPGKKVNSDLTFAHELGLNRHGHNVTLDFLWLPFVANQSLATISSRLLLAGEHNPNLLDDAQQADDGTTTAPQGAFTRPSLLVHGVGLWDVRDLITPDQVEQQLTEVYRDSLQFLNDLDGHAAGDRPRPGVSAKWLDAHSSLWEQSSADLDIFWGVTLNVNEANLRPDRQAITNERIAQFNQAVLPVAEDFAHSLHERAEESARGGNLDQQPLPHRAGRLALEPLIVPDLPHTADLATQGGFLAPNMLISRSIGSIGKAFAEDSTDGVHFPDAAVQAQLNVILNAFCNRRHEAWDRPDDVTCCAPYPALTGLQYVFFAVVLFALVCWLGGSYAARHHTGGAVASGAESAFGATARARHMLSSPNLLSVAMPVAQLGLVLVFAFLCDRTHIFPKERKIYTHFDLIASIGVMFVAGWCTLTHVKTAPTFLSRDQTDEWKGWMQIVFLIYHFLGGSSVLPLYMLVRVFVASYLFLTGFGHFTFFYTKKQFGITRIIQVLTRLNVLTIGLCMVMDKPYQFYYFVPLSSFWFLVVYAIMAFPSIPAVQKRFPGLDAPARILALFTICSIVWLPFSGNYKSTSADDFPIFQFLFDWWPIKELFSVSDSLYEWRFRSGLDCFIVAHGMLIAYAYQIAKSHGVIHDNQPAVRPGTTPPPPGPLLSGLLFNTATSAILSIVSIGIFCWYIMFTRSCTDKAYCNYIHTFSSPFLVAAFAFLRNLTGRSRAVYSRFFAYIGQLSLELFLLQFHIWLAADTKGILVLIPGTSGFWRLLNAAFTTGLFVAVSEVASDSSALIVSLLAPGDNTRAVISRFCGLLVFCGVWWMLRQALEANTETYQHY
ncbi:hypothetical protein, variant [Capsaspora owczarzaki ATCC 30864]|nr:hypothetical protein, variant [Capsaspora owczarzaki ATCC 30864]